MEVPEQRLGLFLCSSVFLSLLSFSYQQWTRAVERRRAVEQLDLEIGLRIQELQKMATRAERGRYSHLVNIQRVIGGQTDRFYVRKPLFTEFENKSITTLLWQLYLDVSSAEQAAIRKAITQFRRIDDLLNDIRRTAPLDVPDRPKPANKAQEDAQDDEDDVLKKDYGQAELYRLIEQLSQTSRWHDVE
jgi:hypothetical protein